MINSSLQIAGITKPAIFDYFNTINQEEFIETANLFTENGVLFAPFESPLEGREAIASYLAKEAKGMKLEPQHVISENLADNEENFELIKVTGKVHTSLFSVNVRWEFTINSNQQLEAVKIKLLASPQELLKYSVKTN
ncbi:water-soluble carotenoid protein [Stanieria sp. NIES-3757]|nr:water-soluble carotenoid protein [Stanieria sp. NIES-3757]